MSAPIMKCQHCIHCIYCIQLVLVPQYWPGWSAGQIGDIQYTMYNICVKACVQYTGPMDHASQVNESCVVQVVQSTL